LGIYAPIIGYTLVVLVAAGIAWAVWRKNNSIRRNRNYAWPGLPHELQTILNEFHHSIEASQVEAQKAAKVGEAVMAAAKPIELALRDFDKRITELQKRTDTSEKQSAELKLSLVEGKKSLEGHAHAVEQINGRLDGLNQQLAAVTEQLSSLAKMIENGVSRQKETDKELRALGGNLVAIQAQVNGLSQRMDVEETGQARLSDLAESVAKSMAALKAVSEDTAQRIAALEPRIMWKIQGLEALVNSTLATIKQRPTDDVEDIPRWR
jgi:chromosome segregation ATPase